MARHPGFSLRTLLPLALGAALGGAALAQQPADFKRRYTKHEYQVPMRDGVKLFTSVYVPRDRSEPHPILLTRTPYSVSPYGPEDYRGLGGRSERFVEEGYIFAWQDVRGRYMSEGEFEDMRPQRPVKSSPVEIDESSDTYDTIDWLVKNVPNNSGRVGLSGISYPGFYTAAGMIDSHPALKAASPQAPIADWFVGDDFHHHGAFFLFDAFDFYAGFGRPRPKPTTEPNVPFSYPTPDAYRFFLEMGPLRNADARYFKGDVRFWHELMRHGAYDPFWKARNLLPHLKNIHAAVMTVGGWFDAEDLYGPLHTYAAVERQNPGISNTLVMGPWFHGGWSRGAGASLGDIKFGSDTGAAFREEVEFPFFNYHLKGKGQAGPPEARVFCTGANEWLTFDQWPPALLTRKSLYFQPGGKLAFTAPADDPSRPFDQYASDPSRPVPYTAHISSTRGTTYMTEDQRFAARRPDVLVYQTVPLTESVAVAGPVQASLFVSTTGTDADFVVKLIDVLPDQEPAGGSTQMGGYQMLVRAEVMRAKFRNSYEKPQPLLPGQVTPIRFELRDVCHTFKPGHRIMAQVQSSWFPLVDRNPQRFTDIYQARETDFQAATHRVYHSAKYPSRLVVGVRGG